MDLVCINKDIIEKYVHNIIKKCSNIKNTIMLKLNKDNLNIYLFPIYLTLKTIALQFYRTSMPHLALAWSSHSGMDFLILNQVFKTMNTVFHLEIYQGNVILKHFLPLALLQTSNSIQIVP